MILFKNKKSLYSTVKALNPMVGDIDLKSNQVIDFMKVISLLIVND
jgi:hypothetical protein